jgi:hypothetical protein
MAHSEKSERVGAPQAPAGGQQLPQEAYYQRGRAERTSRSSLGLALVVIGLIWLAVTVVPGRPIPGAPEPSPGVVVDQSLPGRRLVIDAGSADVEIGRTSAGQIHVVAERSGGSDGDFQVQISSQGDTVRVSHTSQPCVIFCFRSLRYHIELPQGVAADVRTVSGDMRIDDVDGGLALQTTSGSVSLHDVAGPLTAESVSGDISLDSGNVTGASVRTISGDIQLHGVSRDVVAQTVSGDVQIDAAGPSGLTLSSTSGDIEYRGPLAPEDASRANSISGDVTMQLPQGSAFGLDVSTVSGDISNEFDISDATQASNQLKGQVGSDGPQLTISTTSGDVALERQ